MPISELYQSFNDLRNTPVNSFIEPEVAARASDSISQMIGILIDKNSYDVFIPLSGKVAVLNIRGEKVEEDIPIFLIGLPEDPLDAELAKSKFANIVKLLKTVYTDIEEARCRLKIREIQGARKRYEIDSNIISTHAVTSYANSGWDLAKMFDLSLIHI